MKAFRILKKNFGDAFKSVFRNFSLSIASITCTTITLFLVALAILISANVNNFTEDLKKDLTIVVFMERDSIESDVKELKASLEKNTNIETLEFQSKEDVKNDMKSESEVYNTIMSSWTAETNPLQNQFMIKVKDVDAISETANDIKNLDKVDTVKYGEGMVDQLIYVFNIIENATIIVVIALILVTAFLISNTIKLTIYSRKTEIEIMRLVGTSNFIIRMPFVIEGFILGVIGAILPVIITIYGYIIVYDYFGGYLFSRIIKLINPNYFIFYVALMLVGIGAVVGMIGSYRAVRKYLKI